MAQKNILVAISGLTPQIVSEAFYCLAIKKKILINEIFIITTKIGNEVILGKNSKSNPHKKTLKNEIFEICSKFKIPFPDFENNSKHIIIAEEESLELYDIRSDTDNRLFPNKVAEILRKLTANYNNVIHCCLSGGRKSMSAHLALSLSLFARSDDKLYHVLTNEKFEFGGFYPKSKNEDKALVIADIPFIKLRGLLKDKLSDSYSYSALVELTQKELKTLIDIDKLIINIESQELEFKGKKIHLEPQLFVIYFLILKRALSNKIFISTQEIDRNIVFSEEFFTFFENNYNYYSFKEKTKKDLIEKGFEIEDFRSKVSKINKRLEQLFEDPDYYNHYYIQSKRNYGDTKYFINSDKNKIIIIHQ